MICTMWITYSASDLSIVSTCFGGHHNCDGSLNKGGCTILYRENVDPPFSYSNNIHYIYIVNFFCPLYGLRGEGRVTELK